MKTLDPSEHDVEVLENVWIPLPDGGRMAARIWLPAGARERPAPAIFEYLPYRKRDLMRTRDDINHGWLAAQGFACVRVDMRGSGESDGLLSTSTGSRSSPTARRRSRGSRASPGAPATSA